MAREGPSSYTILAKPKTLQSVHRDQLKPFVADEVSGNPLAIFEYQASGTSDASPDPNTKIDCIRDHRLTTSGDLEFLVHWREAPSSDDTWEAGRELQEEWGNVLEKYCLENDLDPTSEAELSPIEESSEEETE